MREVGVVHRLTDVVVPVADVPAHQLPPVEQDHRDIRVVGVHALPPPGVPGGHNRGSSCRRCRAAGGRASRAMPQPWIARTVTMSPDAGGRYVPRVQDTESPKNVIRGSVPGRPAGTGWSRCHGSAVGPRSRRGCRRRRRAGPVARRGVVAATTTETPVTADQPRAPTWPERTGRSRSTDRQRPRRPGPPAAPDRLLDEDEGERGDGQREGEAAVSSTTPVSPVRSAVRWRTAASARDRRRTRYVRAIPPVSG